MGEQYEWAVPASALKAGSNTLSLGVYGTGDEGYLSANYILDAIELVGKMPQQNFVVDHLAKPEIKARKMEPWAGLMREMAANPNVYCKLSGLVTEGDWKRWRREDFEPYLDVVFEAFGGERVMFGSDWPVCLVASSYGRAKAVVESYVEGNCRAAREKVFGSNAASFYSLV